MFEFRLFKQGYRVNTLPTIFNEVHSSNYCFGILINYRNVRNSQQIFGNNLSIKCDTFYEYELQISALIWMNGILPVVCVRFPLAALCFYFSAHLHQFTYRFLFNKKQSNFNHHHLRNVSLIPIKFRQNHKIHWQCD